jgi:hypothetical protein
MRVDKESEQNFGSETSWKTFTWMTRDQDNIKMDLKDIQYEDERWLEPS